MNAVPVAGRSRHIGPAHLPYLVYLGWSAKRDGRESYRDSATTRGATHADRHLSPPYKNTFFNGGDK